jgi:leader peptidase (prepilin peptidase)/N-methyltransferase
VLGLLIGSFVNVVAYRVPEGRSIIRPGSACPQCGAPIRPRDNIPVVSWLLLRARCRECGTAISARYPLVEAATAALFAVAAVVIGADWVLVAYWWFAAVTLTLVLTDLDHHRIPNRILLPGILVGAVLLLAGALADGEGAGGGIDAYLRALGGASAYFAFLFVVALAARGGFGFGDVKLAFLLGLFCAYRSWEVLVVAVFLAFLIGGVVALVLLLTGRRGRKEAIPFGPALVAGAYLAIAFGARIADWYTGL